MDWLENWNRALNYLEDNLEGTIHLEELSRLAGCSAYHFQRMFSYLAGIPLREYVRRRMTRAAADLQRGERVLDTALRYGYESPTAFNRAFQSVHGVPPSAAKRDGVKLKAFPQIHFKFVLKGASEMDYQIIQRNEFRIVGFRTPLPMDAEESFRVVPQFWSEMGPLLPQLLPLMNGEPAGVLGVSSCHQEKGYYYIAVASCSPVPKGMCEWTVPAADWAVFSGQGQNPGAIQNLQKRIVSEWMPGSGYEWAQAPDIEVYQSPPGAAESQFQVWLPIIRSRTNMIKKT